MPDFVLMHLLFLSSALHLTVSPYISMRVGQSLSILMDPSIILQCTGTSRIPIEIGSEWLYMSTELEGEYEKNE